jgi:penicillin-insensitive murein endopeptidase
MLDEKREQPNKLFNAKVVRLLQFAVADTRVDRIFVHPALKRGLCRAAGDHAWLHKLRPWWGHHDHFHVRLACPADSRNCQAQPTLPPGDGCAEIDWWFRKEADGDRQKAHEAYSAKVGAGPTLPPRCDAVLAATKQ